jgi:hypothetical protein
MSISAERLAEIKAFKNTDFSDCPILTKEQLSHLRPAALRHPEWYGAAKNASLMAVCEPQSYTTDIK